MVAHRTMNENIARVQHTTSIYHMNKRHTATDTHVQYKPCVIITNGILIAAKHHTADHLNKYNNVGLDIINIVTNTYLISRMKI